MHQSNGNLPHGIALRQRLTKVCSSVIVTVGIFVCKVYKRPCVFIKLVNRSCVIVERNYVFNLWAVENDLSTDALVAGFTNISLHTEMYLTMYKRASIKWKFTTRYSTEAEADQSFFFCYRYGRNIRLQGLQETLCVCQVGKSLLCHC